jgi:N-acyl-L-homoserine lactone synthetase
VDTARRAKYTPRMRSNTIEETHALLVRRGEYSFKMADSLSEIEQIHRLNYLTFVQEVSQHPENGTGMLVDKFHPKNRYIVSMVGDEVVGMLAIHDQPPFSIAEKLPEPAQMESLGPRPLEVRLLAVKPSHRQRLVFSGLMWSVHNYACSHGYSHLLISAVLERQQLYLRMGFRTLGPPVTSGSAEFIPMVLHLSDLPTEARRYAARGNHKALR